MKKLLKKKINIFGKKFSALLVAFFAVSVFVTALLVPYISNTVTGSADVSSPLEIKITSISDGGYTANSYTITLYGGQNYTVDTDLIVHAEVTGHLSESVIYDFDGEGMTVTYAIDGLGEWEIDGCQAHSNTYYYIGDPDDVLPADTVIPSVTTIETALNLFPDTYDSTTTVILAENAECGEHYDENIHVHD